MSVQEFIDRYKDTSFLSYIICDKDILDDTLVEIFNYLNNKYKNIYLKNFIYILKEGKFEECYDVLKTIPSTTTSIIEEYQIKDKSIIKLFKGKVDKIK